MIGIGSAKMEMKGSGSATLGPGVLRHDAQQTCASVHMRYGLLAFVYSDGAFDIHYEDANGKEIPPDAALAKKK